MMKRNGWIGWLVAGLLVLQNAAAGFAAPAATNPLEGHLLQHSNGTWYVYHAGLKFTVQPADVGDQLIDVIPLASSTQWETFLGPGSGPDGRLEPAPRQPMPFPGHYS